MKNIKIFFTILACLTLIWAPAQNKTLTQKAQTDALKVQAAVGLDKKQFRKIYTYQIERYEGVDRINKDKSLSAEEKNKQKKVVNDTYLKKAESVMTPEQVKAFHKWRASK